MRASTHPRGPHSNGTTRRRDKSAARLRTYAAFDARCPHCRSKRRDDHERGGPATRALGGRGARVRELAGARRTAPRRLARRAPRPPGTGEAVPQRRPPHRLRTLRRAAKGTSRDVIAIRDTPARCLVIVMAHADTVPPAPAADDNVSGVGTLVALAPALAQGQAPACDTWLVATGSEERPYTRQPDHLGAKALVDRLRRTNRLADVHFALSLDEVGRCMRFELRSPVTGPRANVETLILEAARAAHVNVTWLRDSATGNSDHRELSLAGAPAANLGVPGEPLRHTAKDTPDRLQRGAFARVLRVVWPLLRDVS
ncbi:MAG: M28 family metallopeptidase [Solirubrobacteraceae bacterium]